MPVRVIVLAGKNEMAIGEGFKCFLIFTNRYCRLSRLYSPIVAHICSKAIFIYTALQAAAVGVVDDDMQCTGAQ
jgi:hypothetical protein